MRVAIDGSNIGNGGGLTTIVEVLRAAQPHRQGVSRVIFWGGAKTLEKIQDRPWLEKVHEPMLDRSFPLRRLWRKLLLQNLASQKGCDLLFCPGGSYTGSFRPFVEMRQNMLPFAWLKALRHGISLIPLKLIRAQSPRTPALEAAPGVIYLSGRGAQTICAPRTPEAIIFHGISADFFSAPRPQRRIENCSAADPFRILHVSTLKVLQYQWRVAEAVVRLKREGLPVMLDIVGPAYRPSSKPFQNLLAKADPNGMFIRCPGAIPHSMLSSLYRRSELFVYASGCENIPWALLEAMACGLPIACSNRGPVAEMLKDACLYFDPESSEQIAAAMRELILDRCKRRQCSALAYRYAGSYRWERCADHIFSFLSRFAARGDSSLFR
ncbi:MAG: glycosyltransferase [Syntrophobacteraceae bacterium]|nr:glycosyltransferase [Syntrophobacteraceae bacterium]